MPNFLQTSYALYFPAQLIWKITLRYKTKYSNFIFNIVSVYGICIWNVVHFDSLWIQLQIASWRDFFFFIMHRKGLILKLFFFYFQQTFFYIKIPFKANNDERLSVWIIADEKLVFTYQSRQYSISISSAWNIEFKVFNLIL